MTADRIRPAAARRVRVGEGSAGQRLDNFLLRELAGVPRSRIYRLLRRGEVRVNGGRKQADYRLAAEDEVRLPPLREAPERGESPRRVPDALLQTVRQAIVHEDARMLVLNKPAGLAVHGGSGLAFGVIEALRALRPEEPLELVHRLDRDTSGCLLVARTRATLRAAHALLREGSVEKRYAALLAGRWRLGHKTIDAPVLTHARQGGERMVRVHRAGKIAVSAFAPVAALPRVRDPRGRLDPHWPHAPDPGTRGFRGPSGRGGREVRRSRMQRAAARGGSQAHVPARIVDRFPMA